MSYSITPVLHNRKDKQGLQKLHIRVIYKRAKEYATTEIKLRADQFDKEVINLPEKMRTKLNALIRKQVAEIETRLLDALHQGKVDKALLKKIVKGERVKTTSALVSEYADEIPVRLKGKYSDGSLRHYKVIADKLERFRPGLRFSDISLKLLNDFEKHLFDIGNSNNTVSKNMQLMISTLHKAAVDGLINKESFAGYKKVPYKQPMPVWLTEQEIDALTDQVKRIKRPSYQVAGYYFLLSCYTGYRIGDAKRFDYGKMVENGKIFLRAKKNGNIVSIPVHKKLVPVLQFCKDNPFDLSEDKARKFVKELCGDAGIKKDVVFHSSRHSFAMLLMAKGFTVDEVSHLIGDSALITKVYARIHNEVLDKKIKKKLG